MAAKRKDEPKKSQLLVALAKQAELFHDREQGDAYATFKVGNHHETAKVRGKGFRSYLARRFYESYEYPPHRGSLDDALNLIEAIAQHDGPERSVHRRLAEQAGKIYLDLGDAGWRVVEIDPTGWRVVPESPVRFIRSRGLGALPEPQSGGTIHDLRPFLNVTDTDWPLVVAWLVAAFRPKGPYCVLVLFGEQGSAKSTTARVLRTMIDPNVAALRSEPKEERDLVIAATNGWVLALDNLSGLQPWLSDALCRISTGGGFGKRQNYTDGEEVLFDSTRPAILNGISEVATRGDLLDRSILINLPPISDDARRTESDLNFQFEAMRPRILGALLDAVAAGLRNLPSTRLESVPRMADFFIWTAATAPALGFDADQVLAAYRDNRRAGNNLAIEDSPIGGLIQAVGTFTGTAKDLLGILSEKASDAQRRHKDWPNTPRALSGLLRRLTPNLRAVGVLITFYSERTGARRRLVSIETVGETVGDDGRTATVSTEAAENARHETDETVETVQPLPTLRPSLLEEEDRERATT